MEQITCPHCGEKLIIKELAEDTWEWEETKENTWERIHTGHLGESRFICNTCLKDITDIIEIIKPWEHMITT